MLNESKREELKSLYKKEFQLRNKPFKRDPYRTSYYWFDLNVKDTTPGRNGEGVIFEEDSERVYLQKGEKSWVRLKTPALGEKGPHSRISNYTCRQALSATAFHGF
ncbi:hypothetical protein K469DRAFT_685610 [Zopfia rhizophila CBS 207.26]|uniref:Uncharacterized protein n=1 Tax=Zopfia rhizophila CBS 207.26 TaxID=1314779 RepID=A0A6A6EB19_9PEZI|nr:hypothetical protein K469DRAFT_685610 [Zopfia rhizophila CBS 207.26]